MGAEKRVVFHVIEIGCGFDVEVCYAVCLGGVGAKNVLPFLGLVFLCSTTRRLCHDSGAGGTTGVRPGIFESRGSRWKRFGARHQTGVSIIALIDALWASACCGTSRT